MSLTTPATRFERLHQSDIYVPFESFITEAAPTGVWDPTGGTKFQLKGWHIVGVVTVVLNTVDSLPVIIGLYDGSPAVGNLVAPLFAMEGTAPVSVQFESSVTLGEGYLSSAADNILNIGVPSTFTLGGDAVVKLSGIVWGEER